MPTSNTANHWIVITNPKAGKRKLRNQRKYVLSELENAGIPYSFIQTEYAGHAMEITREYANKGFENFLVMGGDGSINEVVNGVFLSSITDTSKIKIALIPRGTGNDWGRFWGIAKKDKEAIKIFFQAHSRIIDIGKLIIYKDNAVSSTKYFINSIGYGLDAQVNFAMHRLKKIVGSFSALYTIALLNAIFKYKSIQTHLSINGDESILNLFTMNIANGPYNGGGIKQNPKAVPYDGVFDMMTVEKPSFWDIITALPLIFNGKLASHKVINAYKATKVKIVSEKGMLVEIDGINIKDYVQQSEVSIIPNAIQMIVPRQKK